MSKKNEYIFKGILKTDIYDYLITITSSQLIRDETTVVYSRNFNLGSYTTDRGEKKTCVDIYVMYPEIQNEIPNAKYKFAKLITTHYNEKCSTDEKLKRGEGTQHMINTAMYFISRMCPFIEGFEINDMSRRECDNNTTIVLSYFSITKHRKTWYEKNFEAYIEDTRKHNNKEQSKMEIYKEKVNTLMSQTLPDWEVFEVLYLRNTKQEIQNEIETVFNKSATYGELFKNIHKLGISKACVYLQPWIDILMLSSGLTNDISYTQWIIPIQSVKRIPLLNYKKDFFGKK